MDVGGQANPSGVIAIEIMVEERDVLFQANERIRDFGLSGGLGDVYKWQRLRRLL